MNNEINELKSSLIYRMSLGSKELYHSNVLAYLIENKHECVKIFYPEYDNNDNIEIKDFHNRKVLIIDDEDYSSNKLTTILKKYNFDIKCIQSGKEAINAIKCDENYALIIVTENVKDLEFVEVGRILKQLRKYISVPPFIALTVSSAKYREGNYYDEYLLKPLDIKELDEIIKKRCL